MDEHRVFGGRYRIAEKIGIGGMAEVYKAQDEVLGRTLAIKVMLPQYAADPSFAARFRQEAQAAANLQSPYIVNIYDWGSDEGTYFIAMELVRGIDLKTAIQERGHIHPRKVAEIAAQVCSALTVAHGYDIIHRDIKPQNIMVQPDGNAKVMDFGIARAGNLSITTTNAVLGTAHYVSPEQAQGKELTATSDLYSLGITMYEAATGKLPFDGPDAVSVAMKQVTEAPIPPSQINPEIDSELEGIILHAMEKDPTRRFSTAAEMRDALRAYLAGMPLPTWNSTVAGDNAATSVITPVGYTAGSTNVMPAISGNGSPANQHARNVSTYDDSKKSSKRGVIIAAIIGGIALIALVSALFLSGIIGGSSPSSDTVTVPTVTGLTQDAAETAITSAGLTVGTVSQKTSTTVDEGKVISQTPSGNKTVDKGSSVGLVISSGAGTVTVPDLSNMTADQANAALTSAGLVGKQGTSTSSENVPSGEVINQTPAANSSTASGTTVTYVLSTGSAKVSVPSVVGMAQNDAKSTLTNAGFQVYVGISEYSSSVDAGSVISQSPSGSSSATKGSTVTITVSKGAEPPTTVTVTVPAITGYTYAMAKSTLTNAGLTGTFLDETTKAASTSGTIVSVSPNEGSTVNSGSTVTVYLQSSSTNTNTNTNTNTSTG